MIAGYYERPASQQDIARWLRTTAIGTPARNVRRRSDYGYRVVYNDPAFAEVPQVVPIDALLLAWSAFDYAVALLTPAD